MGLHGLLQEYLYFNRELISKPIQKEAVWAQRITIPVLAWKDEKIERR
jgi:hypothetical protein